MRFIGRHSRQTRLLGVGAAGQARLSAAEVAVTEHGLAGWVMARYLAGAGVGALSVTDREHGQAAVATDDEVRIRLVEVAERAPIADAELDVLDPAAREVARGARAAVRALGAILFEDA